MISVKTFKLQSRHKNTGRRELEAACTRHSSVNRFEHILDKRTTRCARSSWCRTCLSDDCCLDTNKQTTPKDATNETDEDFKEKLQFLKQRRASTEAYIDHLDKVNTACRLHIVKQPYLLSQDHLPPWLTDVLERGLAIPVVPAFPTTTEAFAELVSELDIHHADDTLLQDYVHAALYGRRLRLGVVGKSQPRPASVSSRNPYYFLCEEIADGSAYADSGKDCIESTDKTRFSQMLVESRANSGNKTSRATRLAYAIINDIQCCNERAPTGTSYERMPHKKLTTGRGVVFLENDLQQVESSLTWIPLFMSSNAIIQECRSERILITGEFPTDTFGNLQFKLVLFPGNRVGTKHMRLTGSFLRCSERTRYNLKWKYDIHIAMTFSSNMNEYV